MEQQQRHPGAPGEAGEASGRTTIGDQPYRAAVGTTRVIRGGLAAGTVGLVVFALGWLWWQGALWSPANEHWAAVARGREAIRRGQPGLALKAVSDVRDEAPGAGEAMTVAGLALLRLGEYRGARLALERALKLQPDQFDAAVTLAELNFGLGNGLRGVEVLETAARLRPRDFRVWLTMGKVLNDLGDLPKATEAFEKALGLTPNDRDALIGLIGCLIGTDQSDRATPWLKKAIAAYPDDPRVLGFAARGAFDANRPDEAIALADRALSRDPQNLHALLARARARVVRNEWRQALPDAERARDAQPNDLGSLQLLQKIQAKLGLTEQATRTQAERVRARERIALMDRMNQEISRHPEDPKPLCTMGQAAWDAGYFLLASRCFEAALALDPSFQQARSSLAALRAARPELAQSPGRPALFLPAAGVPSPSPVTSPYP